MSATYNTTDTRFILFRIADAIENGVIIVGVNASVGPYRVATGDDAEFRIVFYNGTTHDVATTGSIDAASHFIAIEGAGNATRALNKALADISEIAASVNGDDHYGDFEQASEDELNRTRYGEERTEAIAAAHLDAYAEYYG